MREANLQHCQHVSLPVMYLGDLSYPKLTESVMVQFPISQVQPVMKERTVLPLVANWKDQ